MTRLSALFLTHRGERHQQAALSAAPEGLEITLRRSPSKAEILQLLPGRQILISERSGVIDADMICAGRDLQLIQRLGSQTHDIDLAAARRAGVPVCSMPVNTCVMVAEHMVMQMLVAAKRLREMMQIAEEAAPWGQVSKLCDEDTFAYNWSSRRGIRGLYRSTVGIVGFGEIGGELARRLLNFGCRTLYNKRSRLPEAAEAELGLQYTGLAELLGLSDFVCMLLPYFSETAKIVNEQFLGQMKPGAILVSCGGSGTLDEPAVLSAVLSGKLHGFATDTYVWEPVHPENPLLPLARKTGTNIYLTPHTAAGSQGIDRDERAQDYTNIVNLFEGRPLLNRIV